MSPLLIIQAYKIIFSEILSEGSLIRFLGVQGNPWLLKLSTLTYYIDNNLLSRLFLAGILFRCWNIFLQPIHIMML